MGLAIKYGTDLGKFFITLCVFISQMNMAYCDTVTDALSLQASKHNYNVGHEKLQSLQLFANSLGGVCGCVLAALFHQ